MNFDNNIPIYIQLVNNLKNDIISGSINSGDKLPSVRELAISNKVNPNTMQKALGELETLGLIYTERTNGKYVTKDKELIAKFKDEYAKNITNEYLTKMQNLGCSKELILKYLSKGVK